MSSPQRPNNGSKTTSKRPHGQLRQSQLITTYGPGAMVDLPRHSVIIAGLDDWMGASNEIVEPRLNYKVRKLLGREKVRLISPPPDTQDIHGTQTGVRAFRFPEWFVTQVPFKVGEFTRRRYLVRWNRLVEKGKALVFEDDKRFKYDVVPVRFVKACPEGHIADIDWYRFVHGDAPNDCQKQRRQLFWDEEGTSGDLSQLVVGCDCGAAKRMSEAANWKTAPFGPCFGERPWLGKQAKQECKQISRLLVRSASNAYFSNMLGVISLPERNEALAKAVDLVWEQLQVVDNEQELDYEKKKPAVKQALGTFSNAEIMKTIEDRRSGGESAKKPVKQAELEILLDAKKGGGNDVPDGVFYARRFDKAFTEPWMQAIDKVVLIHRLREVIAQVGFTRFEAESADFDGELPSGVKRAELALDVDWVPAIENKGEGFFISFKKELVEQWLTKTKVADRQKLFAQGFASWMESKGIKEADPPNLPYIMLHSLAHMLISSVSLECGYPSSSIRERIYALPDLGYGILLYTGSSDAEGTLGGLVEAGKNIARHMKAALDQGELCSNDPVCSEHLPNDELEQRHLLGAACHGCLLIAETSCERFNQHLDRALVVPTVHEQDTAFFPSAALNG